MTRLVGLGGVLRRAAAPVALLLLLGRRLRVWRPLLLGLGRQDAVQAVAVAVLARVVRLLLPSAPLQTAARRHPAGLKHLIITGCCREQDGAYFSQHVLMAL